nr:Chain I, Atg13 17LR [Lachancea thermotolerans]5JHF_J Chain J, Atg13 17LR [Lachancea thermotolerans]
LQPFKAGSVGSGS